MEPKDVRLMFNIIIDICERTFFLNMQQDQQVESQLTEIFDEKIYQLPSFLESLAYVCNQIDDNLPEGSVNVIEKLVILAIDSYPKLIKRYSYQISLSIAHLFISIQINKPSFYVDFISRIVYQSLIRIFSYKTNYFLQQQEQTTSNRSEQQAVSSDFSEAMQGKNIYNVTSADYIMFWSNLLNLNEFKELNIIGVHVNEKKKLIAIIYDEILESLIKIMNKLDLNAVKMLNAPPQAENPSSLNASSMAEMNASSNPAKDLRPVKPRDFEILINLVDFAKWLFDLFLT